MEDQACRLETLCFPSDLRLMEVQNGATSAAAAAAAAFSLFSATRAGMQTDD